MRQDKFKKTALALAMILMGATAWSQNAGIILLPDSVPNGTFTATCNGIQLHGGDTVRVGDIIHFTSTPNPGYRQNAGTITSTHVVTEIDVQGSGDITGLIDAPEWQVLSDSVTYQNGLRTTGLMVDIPARAPQTKVATYVSTVSGKATINFEWAINQFSTTYGQFTMNFYVNGVSLARETLNSRNTMGSNEIRNVTVTYEGTGNDTLRWELYRYYSSNVSSDSRTGYVGNVNITLNDYNGYEPTVPQFKKVYAVNVVNGDDYVIAVTPTDPVAGETVTLQIGPDSDPAYDVKAITAGGNAVSVKRGEESPDVTTNLFSFTMPSDDVTVTAVQYAAPALVDDFYQIGTADELYWFALKLIEHHTSINVRLTADIDYRAYDQALGTHKSAYSSFYKGTFDGNYHTITYNLSSDCNGYGLIPLTDTGCLIKNLHVAGTMQVNNDRVGSVAGSMQGGGSTLENCVSTVDMVVNNNGRTFGGIIGDVSTAVTLRNCLWNGTATGQGSFGGIAAYVGNANTSTIANCLALGTVTGVTAHYAISGNDSRLISLTNCYALVEGEETTFKSTMVTPQQVKSGEVAWWLNGSNALNPGWFQKLNGYEAQDYPLPWGQDVVVEVGHNGTDTFYGGETTSFVPTTADVELYMVTQTNSTNAGIRAIDAIPAGTPVLVQAPAPGMYNLTIAHEVQGIDTADNLLMGASDSIAGNGTTLYSLGEQDGNTAFLLLDTQDKVNPGRAYMLLADDGDSKREIVPEDQITGIDDIVVPATTHSTTYYNVMGQRVDDSYRGLVITRGKKLIVR